MANDPWAQFKEVQDTAAVDPWAQFAEYQEPDPDQSPLKTAIDDSDLLKRQMDIIAEKEMNARIAAMPTTGYADELLNNIVDPFLLSVKQAGLEQDLMSSATKSLLLGMLPNSVERGYRTGENVISSIGLDAGINDPAETARTIAVNERRSREIPPSPEAQSALKQIQSTDGLWDATKTAFSNPAALPDILGESAGTFAPVMLASVGAKNKATLAAIAALGNFGVEYGSAFLDALNSTGVDTQDDAKIAEALQDPELMDKARVKGTLRGLATAAFSAIGGAVAGRLMNGAKGVGSHFVRGVGEAATQGGLGSAGEAAAQLLSEGKISSPSDVVLEGFAELPTGLVDVGVGTGIEAGKSFKRPGESPSPIDTSMPNSGALPPENIEPMAPSPLRDKISRFATAMSAEEPIEAQPAPTQPQISDQELADVIDGTKPVEDIVQQYTSPEEGVGAVADTTDLEPILPEVPQPADAIAEGVISQVEGEDARATPISTPASPIIAQSDNDVLLAGSHAASSPFNDRAEPTQAQKEAGNYKKGHIKVQGLDIAIETPRGGERSGVDPSGKPWSVQMRNDYGYIKRTEGADGDHLDVFLGNNPQSQQVYVIDQINPDTGVFDEHKALIGFDSAEDAVNSYVQAFNDGRGLERIGSTPKAMPMRQFKAWVKSGSTKKPVGRLNLAPKALKNQLPQSEVAPTTESAQTPIARARSARQQPKALATTQREPVLPPVTPPASINAVSPQSASPNRRRGYFYKPKSLLEFVAEKGIRDEGGEITHLGINKFYPGKGTLIRKGGQSLDYAREAAVEAGYGNFKTVADFINALDESKRRPIYSAADQNYMVEKEQERALAKYDQSQEAVDEFNREREAIDKAERLGIRTEGRDIEDIELDVREREAIQAEDAVDELLGREFPDILNTINDEIPFSEGEGNGSTGQTGTQPAQVENNPAGNESQRPSTEKEVGQGGRTSAESGRSSGGKRSGEIQTEKETNQTVIPGAEKISDRELAERKSQGRLKATKPQIPADDGLFDVSARSQSDLLEAAKGQKPQLESKASTDEITVNLPDPTKLTPEALYRTQRKVEKAFLADNAAKAANKMSDEEFSALENYARKLEREIETRGKTAVSEKLRKSKSSDGGASFQRNNQILSAAFKQWFGKSKIVDKAGNPLVVYHGTADDVQSFDKNHPNKKDHGWLGNAAGYFTNSKDGANIYVKIKENQKADKSGGNVMPVYIKLENPFFAPLDVKREMMNASLEESQAYANELKRQGYDGVELIHRDGTREYAVFDAKNIKSAIGNNGNFSASDQRVDFQRKESEKLQSGDTPNLERGNNYLYRLKKAFTGKEIDAMLAIEEAVRRIFGKNISLRYADVLMDEHGNAVDGAFTVEDIGFTIAIALAKGDDITKLLKTAGHELIHALHRAKTFSKSEWNHLRYMARNQWMETYNIEKRYRKEFEDFRKDNGSPLTPAQIQLKLEEEAIAEAFADYLGDGKIRAPQKSRTIFSKIKSFLADLRDTVGKKFGWQNVDDIFEKTNRGDRAGGGFVQKGEGIPAFRRKDTKEEVKKVTKKKFNAVRKWGRRNFTKEGLLNDETFQKKLEMDGIKNADELDIEAMVYDFEKDISDVYGKAYSQLSVDEKRKLRDHLAGQDVAVPDKIKPRIAHMREYLDRSSTRLQEAIADLLDIKIQDLPDEQRKDAEKYLDTNGAEGKMPEYLLPTLELLAKIQANKGTYLNRSYQAFDDPKWKDKVLENSELMKRAEEYIAAQNPKLTPEEVTGAVRAILQGAKEKGNFVSFLSGGTKVGAKDVSFLKKRKDIDPVIRELLGEYEDPKVTFIRSASKMSNYLAGHYFLKGLREAGLGSWLHKRPTGEFDTKVAGDKSDQMTPINGLYTTEDFNQGMIDAKGAYEGSELMKTIIGLNSMVKYGKTILSPTTQVRNFLSAAMFTVMNGHFNWTHMAEAFAATKSDLFTHDEKWRAYLNDLVKRGVLHDNPNASELREAIRDATEGNIFSSKGKVSSFLSVMQRLYRSGDDFWKIIGYENEKALLMKHRGITEEAAAKIAAQRIRDGYPTYSMVPRGIRKLRTWPLIGTFVSFPWEIMRTSVNQLRFVYEDAKAGRKALVARRVLGMSIALGLAEAIKQMTMMAMGLDDDDDEAIRDLAPEWQKNATLAYLGYDENGLPSYMDLTAFDPYSYLKKPINALMNGNNRGIGNKVLDALEEIATPFVGPDIAAGALGEIIMNKKFGGGEVYNEEDTPWGRTVSIAKHLQTLAPGFVSNLERTARAAMEETTRSGKKYTLKDEGLAWIGFRTTTLNILQSLRYLGYDFLDRKRNASRLLSYPAGSAGKVSDKELESAYEKMQRSRTNLYSDMIRAINAARKLGVDDEEILGVLESSGVGKKDVMDMLEGTTPDWEMSKQFLKNAEQGAYYSTPDKAEREKVIPEMERRREAIDLLTQKITGQPVQPGSGK